MQQSSSGSINKIAPITHKEGSALDSYLMLERLANEKQMRRLQEIENARLIRLASGSRPDLRVKLLLLLGEKLIGIGSSLKKRYSQAALDSRCQAYFARSKRLHGSNKSEVAIRLAPKCECHSPE